MHALGPGIVDQAIHGTEFVGHLLRGALKRRSVGYIEAVGVDASGRSADFLKRFGAPPRYDDAGTLASERHGKPSANAGAATGD
jgi:hypothetical protein